MHPDRVGKSFLACEAAGAKLSKGVSDTLKLMSVFHTDATVGRTPLQPLRL